MNLLEHLSRPWLLWIGAASWQLALFVCLVALISRAARAAPAKLRYGLWLLVLVKVFLPPSLTTPLSIGQWGVGPLLERAGVPQAPAESPLPSASSADKELAAGSADRSVARGATDRGRSLPVLLMSVWAGGCMLFWGVVGWRYGRLARALRSDEVIDEGPVRIALEQIAMDLKLRIVPELLVTKQATGPFLFGVIRPRIVLPEGLLGKLDDSELRAVLTHELVHWKRRDTWIGWAQVLVQGLFWFHPFAWWANGQLRHERECVCDETVLRVGRISPEQYGESIFRVLTAARGRSLAAGSLVGVFERGAKLQNRLENIMSHESSKREFGWGSRLALAVFAVTFLPMAPGGVDAPRVAAQDRGSKAADAGQAAKTSFPTIVSAIPGPGAAAVDPGLAEITVTFDRDMGKGMSWTGGPPLFPPIDRSRQARWTDARTCVLPVKLEMGNYYRLGINSTSNQNFRSSDGVPAPPSVIYFTTMGASMEINARLRIPTIEKLEPENGAMDVDPATQELRVTFNVPMGAGMSWTGGGPQFPKIVEGKTGSWSSDRRTCTLPVSLEPGHDYQLGINSLSHINFQSEWGVPLKPVVYKFRTRGAGK